MTAATPPEPHGLSLAATMPPRESWPPINDHCPIALTLDVVSTRTAFLLLREAFYGATRFEQFAERAQVSEPVAAARLKELTAAGLLRKAPYREPGQRTRHEYRLTDKGADLLPALIALFDWGNRWLSEAGARLEFTHAGCGAHVHAQLACAEGHPLGAEDIVVGRRLPGRPVTGPAAAEDPARSVGR